MRVDHARMTGDALKFDPNDPTNSLILFENIDLSWIGFEKILKIE